MHLLRWTFTVTMAIGLALTPALTAAEDSISGTVVTADPGSGLFTILQDGTGRLITVTSGSGKNMASIPIGSHITARGEFRAGASDVFTARKIKRGKKNGRTSDPTGVRSRLLKGLTPE